MTALSQYMTPAWAAELLLRRHFPDLSPSDTVLEPTCGIGRWLSAIPAEVPAYGVEIDAELAQAARAGTGRDVITGDILQVELPHRPTVVIGNPPFSVRIIEALLQRCEEWLSQGDRAAMILPAYFFQTAERVSGYFSTWGIQSEIIPRNLFHGLSKPLVFAIFERGGREPVGLALFSEAADVLAMRERYRQALNNVGQSAWKRVVVEATVSAGGTITLPELYQEIAPRRPTPTRWWKEQIRRTAQETLERTAKATYALPREVA